MNSIKRFFLLAILFFVSFTSMAWGPTGHRIVGAIAESYLTPKARAAVAAILGYETPAITSNWPDFIKSDSNFNYLSPWHYINVKQGLNHDDFIEHLKNDTTTDAFTKLNFIIKELKKKQLPADKKLLYLRMLIHIVGDVHQPLHIGQFEDLGGNRVRVLWFSDSTNLHSMWDEKLIDYQKLSYTEYANAINHVKAGEKLQWQKTPIAEWFYESYQMAGKLYNEIKVPNQKLSYRYNFDHIDELNMRLLKAGVRLAGILNEIFG